MQVTESPRLDNVFIMMCAFHIEMAFFKTLGKLTAESGEQDMLTETGVISRGSLNRVLTEKHLNHCMKIHPLLALAFANVHFKAFMKTCDFDKDLRELMSMLQTSTVGYDVRRVTNTDQFKECARQYTDYKNATPSGAHGYTAHLWMVYADYINLFHKWPGTIHLFLDTDHWLILRHGYCELFMLAHEIPAGLDEHRSYTPWSETGPR